MAELADAHGSGPCDGNIMRVQVPSSARLTARYRDVPGFVVFKDIGGRRQDVLPFFAFVFLNE